MSLSESCADLANWLPVAAALIAEQDADGSSGKGKPGPRPPWNSAAANAEMDAHAGVRHLELALRMEAGLPARRRGGSDAATMAAIAAIEALSHANVSGAAIAVTARHLDRLVRQIQELPAVDEVEPWRRVHGVACPYCGCTMLRVQPREGTVTCLRYGACRDADGHHPVGRMDVSRLTGDPLIRWNDGLVAP